MNFIPTKQQTENNNLIASGANTLIKAGAGAGKSSSLRYFAAQNPDKNFLILCFNKSTAAEGNNHPERPNNAFYSTFHSLAFGKVVTGQLKQSFNNSGLVYTDIKEEDLRNSNFFPQHICFSPADERFAVTTLRKRIKQCIETYCRSASRELARFAEVFFELHFNSEFILVEDAILGEIPEKSFILTSQQQKELATFTRNHWLKLIDPLRPEVFGHDQYLKLFQLNNMRPNQIWDKVAKGWVSIDVLCCDESQDMNPLRIAIMDSFLGQKIVVGDDAQQLYAWNGAVSALQEVENKGYEVGYLTNSFRFTQEIADKANKILMLMEQDYKLTGSATPKALHGNHTVAYLSRTNAQVLATLLQLAEYSPGEVFNINIDLNDISKKLYHITAVFFGEEPQYPDASLQHIKTKQDLMEAMAISDDIAALAMLGRKLASKAGTVHKGIVQLKSLAAKYKNESNIFVSTIHKAKGLEYDEVIINNDLLKFEKDDNGEISDEAYEAGSAKFAEDFPAQCLTYVAITRAKQKVTLPSYLEDFINGFGEM